MDADGSIYKLTARTADRQRASEKKQKKIKKLLTNGWHYDIVNKLSPRDDNDE